METVQILSLSLRQQYFLCLTGESREAYLHGSSTNKCLLHQRKFGARALAWLGMQHKQNSLGETEEEPRLQTQLCSSWLRALPEGRTFPGVISASERSVQRREAQSPLPAALALPHGARLARAWVAPPIKCSISHAFAGPSAASGDQAERWLCALSPASHVAQEPQQRARG